MTNPKIPRLLFIVPAYNEEDSLPGVVADLQHHYPSAEIVVINDGSTDNTAALARTLPVTLLDLPFNVGIGGTVQTGLLFGARGNFDIAVQFDGDGQHRADQVERLLNKLQSGEYDVVIGSRFLTQTNYKPPLLRRLGIRVFQQVNAVVLGRKITDNTSGFRAYNRTALEFLAHNYPHDYPEPESVITLCRHGFRVVESSVQMRERQGGKSSITFLRSIYYMGKVLFAILIGATRSTQKLASKEVDG